MTRRILNVMASVGFAIVLGMILGYVFAAIIVNGGNS